MSGQLKAVVASALLAGLAACGGSQGGPRQEIRKAKVERGNVTLSVTATGEITPLRQIELKSKASGQVMRFAKLEGMAVAAGEMLAELDKKVETRNLEREEANLRAAEARLSLLKLELTQAVGRQESELAAAVEDARTKKAELERLERLTGGVMSELDLGNARLNARVAEEKSKQAELALQLSRDRRADDERLAESEVTRARLSVADARDRMADTEVRSPIAGILLRRLVEEGQIVSSGISATTGGTAVAVVADISSLVVVANVDETDIGKVEAGKTAWISVEAHPEKRFKGKVELIPPKGDVESSIVVFKVKIGLDGKHFGTLKAGMTATVAILVDERKDVLHVPSESVRSEKGARYVLGPDGRQRIDVKTGLDDGARCEILEGLGEGAEIAVVTTVGGGGQAGAPMRRFR